MSRGAIVGVRTTDGRARQKRHQQGSGPETREALMEAAIDLLTERGVLAGLNLREVADAVGVTPANIYHLFGSRQRLLREALQRESKSLEGELAEFRHRSFVERRLGTFDMIGAHPRLSLTALPAIDRDPNFRPLPFLEDTRADYEVKRKAGEIRSGLDIDAIHLLSLAVSIGTAVYGESAARQLGVSTEELRRRVRTVFEGALYALIDPDGIEE
jgi:AcrR family transcriptional regulator